MSLKCMFKSFAMLNECTALVKNPFIYAGVQEKESLHDCEL